MREPIFEDFDLTRDQLGDASRARERIELFEDLLALLGLEVDVGGDEIGQSTGIVQVVGGDGHLVGQDRRQLDQPLEEQLQVADQALRVRRLRRSADFGAAARYPRASMARSA